MIALGKDLAPVNRLGHAVEIFTSIELDDLLFLCLMLWQYADFGHNLVLDGIILCEIFFNFL